MNDPKHPAPRHTPRTHPRVGDTYTDATGVATVVDGPDAIGNVKVRFKDTERWTDGWGLWSTGTYARRDPRYDPHVGDVKQYATNTPYGAGTTTYTVTSLEPFDYTDTFGGSGWSRACWECSSDHPCTWTCVEDVPGGAS